MKRYKPLFKLKEKDEQVDESREEKKETEEKDINDKEEVEKFETPQQTGIIDSDTITKLMKRNKPKSKPKPAPYMGKTGDEVFVIKIKPEKFQKDKINVDYKIINVKNKKMIDLTFKSSKEALNYSKKAGMKII